MILRIGQITSAQTLPLRAKKNHATLIEKQTDIAAMNYSNTSNSTNDPASPYKDDDEKTLCCVIRCAQDNTKAVFNPQRHSLLFICEEKKSKIELGFASSRLLELLINRSDTIVTREDILSYAWPDRVVTQNSLNQAISNLRELLGDETKKEIIQTIPRRGYLFNGSFIHQKDAALDTSSTEINSHANTKPHLCKSFLSTNGALITSILLAFAFLIYQVDSNLILQAGLTTESIVISDNKVLYTAPDQNGIFFIKNSTAALRDKILSMTRSPMTLIINKSFDLYDFICVNRDSTSRFIVFHKSQINNITEDQILRCLQ